MTKSMGVGRGNHSYPRMGGRKKMDPNILHHFTLGGGYRYPKRAEFRKKHTGGKISISVNLPPELYNQILDEALSSKKSFQRLVLEILGAGMSPE